MTRSTASQPAEEIVKVVLLGETGVGKSSLALRFVKNEFEPYSEATIGASFMSKTVLLENNKNRNIKFNIWDTAGQEKYHSLAPMYYRGASAAIVVFDLSQKASFDTMQHWVTELKEKGPSSPSLVLAICGNKLDLLANNNHHHRQVSSAQARDYALQVGAFYIETSARDGTNVQELFCEVAKRIPPSSSLLIQTTSNKSSQNVDLRYHEQSTNHTFCC